MTVRLSQDARHAVLTSAAFEAHRRGDRRIGTEHLLLGLLQDPAGVSARALGVDLEEARSAADGLDRAALAAVGVDLGDLGPAPLVARTRRRPPLTSGARAVLVRGVREARSAGARRIDSRRLLLAVLACERPDPAAELLVALGVDVVEARERVARSGG